MTNFVTIRATTMGSEATGSLQPISTTNASTCSSACASTEKSSSTSSSVPIGGIIVAISLSLTISFVIVFIVLRRRLLLARSYSRLAEDTDAKSRIKTWMRGAGKTKRENMIVDCEVVRPDNLTRVVTALVSSSEELGASTCKPFCKQLPPILPTPAAGISDFSQAQDRLRLLVAPPQLSETESTEMPISAVMWAPSDSRQDPPLSPINSEYGITGMSPYVERQYTLSASTESPYGSRTTLGSEAMSSESPSEISIIPDRVEVSTQRAVDTLMSEFRSLLNHSPYIGISIRAGAGSPPMAQGPPDSSMSRDDDSEISSKRLKRSRQNSISSVPCDLANKRAKNVSMSQEVVSQKFACPFYKHDSSKHLKKRSCAGPGWDSIHRVKEHIYRTHRLPPQCIRCARVFNSETALISHQRNFFACERRSIIPIQGINDSQERLLRKRPRGVSEEEKWLEMYRVLFPDEDGDLVPTPYYESSETFRQDAVLHYERIQRRELLRLVRKRLEEEASSLAGPLEDGLRAQFIEIIRAAQTDVFQTYRRNSSAIQSPSASHGGMDLTPEQPGNCPLLHPADASMTDSILGVPMGNAQPEQEPAEWGIDMLLGVDPSILGTQQSATWTDTSIIHFENEDQSHGAPIGDTLCITSEKLQEEEWSKVL